MIAMNSEIESMKSKNVFRIVNRPTKREVLPTMWVYKVKFDLNGRVDKYKARLVVLGNKQSYRNEENNYSPVLNDLSLRILLAFGCKHGMHMHQLDVCKAYLHSSLNQEIYCEQPEGYRTSKSEVWLLLKSVYGLRGSALDWYNTFVRIVTNLKFVKSKVDEFAFVYREKSNIIIIGLYVDDILVMPVPTDTNLYTPIC